MLQPTNRGSVSSTHFVDLIKKITGDAIIIRIYSVKTGTSQNLSGFMDVRERELPAGSYCIKSIEAIDSYDICLCSKNQLVALVP